MSDATSEMTAAQSFDEVNVDASAPAPAVTIGGDSRTLQQTTSSKDLDANDELDYEEEEGQVKPLQTTAKPEIGNGDVESDGEIKSEPESNDQEEDLDDGEVLSPKAVANKDMDVQVKASDEAKEEEKHSEEEGEINDGESVKKAFIPRILCKFHQRGKCTWGRTCKFLHPGVNDTGNYSFLEYQDPTAQLFQQQQQYKEATIEAGPTKAAAHADEQPAAEQTESAWERGLRHAKEMKEKAMRRKQMDKDQFDEKKMNLSLKEFEDEKENDERYMNIESAVNADDDLDEEDLSYLASRSRAKPQKATTSDKPSNERPYKSSRSPERDSRYASSSYRNYDGHDSRRNYQGDQRQRPVPNRNQPARPKARSPIESGSSGRAKADEWHDPWERSRNRKAPAAKKESSSSSSDSDSRSRSGSRSSYSSKSSYSSRSTSGSSTSRSRSPATKGKGTKPDVSKSAEKKLATGGKSAVSTSKPPPGRQVTDLLLKKANQNSAKGKRSRSHSSASSYSSRSDDDDEDDDLSNSNSDSEIDSYSDEDEDTNKRKHQGKHSRVSSYSKKPIGANAKGAVKRSSDDTKLHGDSKKAKTTNVSQDKQSGSKPGDKDKKQLIKDQLKLLESALIKKKEKSMTK